MANGKNTQQLIKAGTSGDSTAFRRASESIIAEERQKPASSTCQRFRTILYGNFKSNIQKHPT